MSINLTLVGQMITFALFVWFTMRFVWPPIERAMRDRQRTIADGLAAAVQAKRDHEAAQQKAIEILRDAKLKGADLIEKSHKQASKIIQDGEAAAQFKAQQILDKAHMEVQQGIERAHRELQQEVGQMAVVIAEKILRRAITTEMQHDLLTEILKEVN